MRRTSMAVAQKWTLVGAALLAVGVGGAMATAPRVRHEGEPAHRAKMDALEGHAPDAAAFAKLDRFTEDFTLTPEALTDSVTLIATVNSTEPKSYSILRTLKRLHDRFADEGLRVLVVHPEEGWDEFEQRIDRGLVRVPAARDAGGAFAAALGTDNHPDVYVFGRSGALRYADIATSSAAPAVVALLKETSAEAADAAYALRGRASRVDVPSKKPGDDHDAPAKPGARPNAPGDIPSAEYASAAWPAHNESVSNNFQGQKLPSGMERFRWISDRPDERSLARKVMVLDFWATWCGPCLRAAPTVAKVQKDHKDEVAVIGVSGSARGDRYPEDPRAIREFIQLNGEHYLHANDLSQTLARNLGVRGIPHVVIISTDGIIRWQGNPLEPTFENVVAQVVDADPYLAAMRRPIPAEPEPEEVPAEPEPAASEPPAVEWPAHNAGRLYASNDMQGEPLDGALGGLNWLDGNAPATDGKVTIIEFWATWCTRCPALRKQLNEIADAHAGDIVAVSISGMPRTNRPETIDVVREHLEQNPSSAYHAHDPSQRLYQQIGVQSPPYAVVLDGEGVVRWQGFPAAVDFPKLIEQMVAANKASQK